MTRIHVLHRPGLGLLALLVALGTVVGCSDSTAPPAPTNPTSSAPTTDPTSDPTAEPTASPTGEPTWVTAYFMLDTRTGLRLARERQDLLDDSVNTAVEAMLKGPIDPDYSTPWNPGTEVLSVLQEDGLITVDLSAEARTANVGSPGAALMIQQLVWTATEAAGDPTAAVQLLIEGDPAGELWGAVTWDEPVMRADPIDVRLLVQIDSPVQGEVFTTGTVTVSGDAAVFEANLPWSLRDAGGVEVESGFTMTSAGQEFAPFSFDLELEPGEYTVEIVEDDPSDGQGGTPMSDTRTFFVY